MQLIELELECWIPYDVHQRYFYPTHLTNTHIDQEVMYNPIMYPEPNISLHLTEKSPFAL